VDLSFGEALLVFGGLLAVAAALSGVMRGTVLSASVLSVGLGIALAEADVVNVDANDTAIVHLVELALVVTLFSDGMFVERELLRRHWSPVTRAIVLAMPITLVLLALVAHGLFGELSWAEAFLLAAVLTPTDPVDTIPPHVPPRPEGTDAPADFERLDDSRRDSRRPGECGVCRVVGPRLGQSGKRPVGGRRSPRAG